MVEQLLNGHVDMKTLGLHLHGWPRIWNY